VAYPSRRMSPPFSALDIKARSSSLLDLEMFQFVAPAAHFSFSAGFTLVLEVT